MADVHNKATRSYNMSRIRSKDTKPEMIVRKFLHAKGFRYRLHVKDLPGKPDIVLPKYKTVIFVHGCFWHGHEGCRYAKVPENNREYWSPKLQYNIEKDNKSIAALKDLGWKTIILWTCTLNSKLVEKTMSQIVNKILM